MRIRIVVLSILIISLLFLTGCWDYNDYENLSLVSGVGIDMDETSNQITVTVLYYIPAQTNAGNGKKIQPFGVVKAAGTTISDALAAIQQTMGKKLFYGYLDAQVIGQTAAKKIMKQIVLFNDCTPNIRTTAYLAIAQGKAEDVLCTFDPNIISEPTAKNIYNLINLSINSGSAFPVSIADFIQNQAIDGIEPVVPRVTAKLTENSKDSGSSENIQNNEPTVISKLKNGFVKIDGMAAFNDAKLIGWLDVKECTGLGYITNKNIATYENVKTSFSNEISKTLIFSVSKTKSKIKAQLENNKPAITVNTYVEAGLRKYDDNKSFDTLTPEAVAIMEKELAKNVSFKMNAAITKAQKNLKSDIFGFGFAFYRSNPKLYHSQYENKWQNVFPNIKVHVNVSAKIINTGSSVKKSFVK